MGPLQPPRGPSVLGTPSTMNATLSGENLTSEKQPTPWSPGSTGPALPGPGPQSTQPKEWAHDEQISSWYHSATHRHSGRRQKSQPPEAPFPQNVLLALQPGGLMEQGAQGQAILLGIKDTSLLSTS
ncbi:unnamed protein product [Rangifer tarandus platyrhynchus]|uniref:Uncharacterized protein n=1 Tax=Rangifer tarandus platyrhynchus TaxID=3082113 RepID=A0ABN8Z0L0_RANTA|nr:unnamed protein product [Rangifer tarandus platyrhynchus]